MTIEQIKKQLQNVIERYSNRTEFTGEVRRDDMARDCLSAIEELEAENARLKEQVTKWHDLTKPLYTEDGVDYYDLPAEHGWYIVDCGGETCTYSEYDPDYNDWCNLLCTTKVFRWCEFPTTEESSVTKKENV